MGFSIIPLTMICVILFIIFAVFASKHGESDEERVSDMIKNFYIYLVCFATLMMTIGGGVWAFMSISDIIVPNTYYLSYEEYKNNQSYKFKPEGERTEVVYSEEELKSMYKEYKESEIDRSRNQAINNLIKSLGWIVIPLPIFIIFSRRLRKQTS